MSLAKTERGREALLAHSTGGLTMAERRVLILCDGRRTRAEIAALLGDIAVPMINRLYECGYIALQGGPGVKLAQANATADVPQARTPPSAAAARPVSAPEPERDPVAASAAEPAASTAAPSAAPAGRMASRRSLAASKMYLVDMLQLQRDPDSVALRAEIQTSPSEDELVYRMMTSLGHLQKVAAASYFQRIGDRLAEILPEQYLARLDQVRAGRMDSAA